jgi:hypothetical protein
VVAVLDRAERGLEKFPAALVVQRVPNSLGYERTPPARPDAPVERSHKLIRELNVQTHGLKITHSRCSAPCSRQRAQDQTAARIHAVGDDPEQTQHDSIPSNLYAASVSAPKKKVTFYLDEDVVRAARVRAARSDRRDSEIVEQALRQFLGFDVVEGVWARSDLNEDEAMELAVSEIHAMRDEKRAAGGS